MVVGRSRIFAVQGLRSDFSDLDSNYSDLDYRLHFASDRLAREFCIYGGILPLVGESLNNGRNSKDI
jgi:hypothetical protein